MGRSITITDRAYALLNEYRLKQPEDVSYSRAIGRLLGVELPKQGRIQSWNPLCRKNTEPEK